MIRKLIGLAKSSAKEIFMKTKNRRAFTFQEKLQHLKLLLEQNQYLFSAPTQQNEDRLQLDITSEANSVKKKIQAKVGGM